MTALPRSYRSVETAALAGRPLHLAIGMFDGVHLGHQAVIEAAVRAAREAQGTAAVLTFRPHPSRLFRPEDPTRLIFSQERQAERLAELGVDAVIVHPFTREFAALPAADFAGWLQRHLPALAAMYVGENWRFGAGRRGDVAGLVASAQPLGIFVYSAPPVNWDGEPVTSTRIRGLLAAGGIAAANRLLGRPYASAGLIAPGRQLGRRLGYPTLNLAWDPELRPRFGVYRVRTGGWAGVANYGVRPTVGMSDQPVLEVHLLGPGGGAPLPGTGDRMQFEWLDFLRPERKFGSVEELQAQIARDAATAAEQAGVAL